MKGLAEFIMRGRAQALLVAVAGAASSLFCWISAAAIALVVLRRGAGAGAWLLLWALLPAGVLAFVYGDTGPLTLLVGTLAMALVLRATVNLPLALLASIAVGVIAALVAMLVGDAYLEELVKMFDQFLSNMEQRLPEGSQGSLQRPGSTQIAGLLGAGTATIAACCLLLARYWQAALYNPGGFGQEFKALRFPAGITAAMVLAGLVLASQGLQLRTWAMICFIPLTFAGLALVHAWAARRGSGSGMLAWFYIAWLLLDPVKLMVVFVAIADSWIDFRDRWAERDGRQGRSGKTGQGEDRPDDPDEEDF